jgi:hypothetical protein
MIILFMESYPGRGELVLMDYVEWCELVLHTMGEAGAESPQFRNRGIDEQRLGQRVWGDHYERIAEGFKTGQNRNVLYNAVFDLYKELLVEDANATFIKLTWDGRKAAQDIFPVWENACLIRLEPVLERALRIINERSNVPDEDFGRVEYVSTNTVCCELGLSNNDLTLEDVEEMLRELKALGLVYWNGGEYPDEVRSTYRGLVWETRRDLVIGARFINGLVAEWETTSVDFKRELTLDTASQKAEFVKDVIGLANTQASGRRRMIIGFDDKTREHHGPPDPRITQDRIEQILGDYIKPFVDVRYEVIDYRASKVGVLEVLRGAGKLPHIVAKSLGDKAAGDKKRIEEGQIFVRHGSQTEPPTLAEMDAIREEAERARSLGGA